MFPETGRLSFKPELIPKRKRDVSDIIGKVLSMYAQGINQHNITAVVEDIYSFDIFHEMISDITDAVLPELEVRGVEDVWKRNFSHVEQLFDYDSAIRKIIYTTNAVESIHSSLRKVTKKGAFSNENALLKLLAL